MFASNDTYIYALTALCLEKLELLTPGKGESRQRERVAALEAEFRRQADATLAAGVLLPLEYVCEIFSLTPFERHCVQFAMLCELDAEVGRRFARLSGAEESGDGVGLLTLELACRLELACQEEAAGDGKELLKRESLLPYFRTGGTLSRFFLTQLEREDRPGLLRAFKLNRRMRGLLIEREWEDPQLAGLAEIWEPEEAAALPPADQELDDRRLAMERAREQEGAALFFLSGPAGSGKEELVREYCRRQKLPILRIHTGELLRRGPEALACIEAECRLYQCVPCFIGWAEGSEPEEEESREALLQRLLQAAASVSDQVFVLAQRDWIPRGETAGLRFIPIAFSPPDALARLRLWERLSQGQGRGGDREALRMSLAPSADLRLIANKFQLTRGQIQAALKSAAEEAVLRGLAVIDQDCLEKGCRRQLPDRFRSGKATPVPCSFQWDDLILPERSKELLRLACNQVAHAHTVYQEWGFARRLPYGRGLSMLFCGPPGTGKTMGAQVVAGELGLPLFRVNLAGVVSKYVGETEKNLQEIFEDAERVQAALFFDEADVLFGKRTEIKGANDKYGNMEAAFLLQKIEEYEGVAILATNYLQNFDEAFKRRIKFVVDFPFPDKAHRLRLWEKAFPPSTPVEADVDHRYLAERFELSGSNIKNIAVNAAFEAAYAGRSVSMAQILRALKNELIKSGKSVSAEEWGEYYLLAERGPGAREGGSRE